MNEGNEYFTHESGSSPAEPASSYTPTPESAPQTTPAYAAYSQPGAPRQTVYTHTPARPAAPAKKSKSLSAGAVIALCLVCAILAACIGAGGMWLALSRGSSETAEVRRSAPVIQTVSSDEGAINETANSIYELAKQQVVGIRTDITYYNVFGQASAASVTGSGFIISEDGYILTNHHVIADAVAGGYQVTVMMYDETTYGAEIIGYDADSDLALLKIDADGLSAAQLADSDELQVGQVVYAVGNPLGELSFSMTSGIVSATDRTITTESDVAMNMFQIDAAVNSGNSGGPVYNSNGQVVGIVTAKYGSVGVEGLGFAIPITDAAGIVNQLIQYGYVTDRANLGISAATVTSAAAERYNMVEGAYVNGVNPGSAADKAGLRRGDIITALNGEKVAGVSELTSMLRKYHAGETAELTVNRDGAELALSVTFDEKLPADESTESASQEMPQQYGQYYSGDIEDFFRQLFPFGAFGY